MNNQVTEAVTVLDQGGIVIFPTDTAFGIGCRLDKPESVDRLFALRRRPDTKAMPVLVDSPEMALSYLDSPSHIVRRLMQSHWPGGLTIVAPCKTDLIYSPIRGGSATIGVRMPDHEITRALITGATVPILGSSANFHGEKTPFHLTDLDPALVQLVDYVVSGNCKVGKASTVVDTTSVPATIIREGAVRLAPHELI